MMRHILVLQWPGSSEADFDDLIEMEDELERSLDAYASVDGHDFGSGEMDIFIETDQPLQAFTDVQGILSHRPRWAKVRAAHREGNGETYTVLLPLDSPAGHRTRERSESLPDRGSQFEPKPPV